jgi:hypothetical protein
LTPLLLLLLLLLTLLLLWLIIMEEFILMNCGSCTCLCGCCFVCR